MGLIRRVVTLPLAPVEGVLWIAQVLHQIAEEELSDPTRLRAALQAAETAHARGELSDEEMAAVEEQILDRLVDTGSLPTLSAGDAFEGRDG